MRVKSVSNVDVKSIKDLSAILNYLDRVLLKMGLKMRSYKPKFWSNLHAAPHQSSNLAAFTVIFQLILLNGPQQGIYSLNVYVTLKLTK